MVKKTLNVATIINKINNYYTMENQLEILEVR